MPHASPELRHHTASQRIKSRLARSAYSSDTCELTRHMSQVTDDTAQPLSHEPVSDSVTRDTDRDNDKNGYSKGYLPIHTALAHSTHGESRFVNKKVLMRVQDTLYCTSTPDHEWNTVGTYTVAGVPMRLCTVARSPSDLASYIGPHSTPASSLTFARPACGSEHTANDACLPKSRDSALGTQTLLCATSPLWCHITICPVIIAKI